MTLHRLIPILSILVLILVGVLFATFSGRTAPRPQLEVAQVEGSPTAMATQSAEPTASAFATQPPGVTPTVLPTEPPPLTYVPLGPTPNATEVAETEMAYFLSDAFYSRSGTVIAQSVDATPTSYPTSGFTLTGYEIEEVTLDSPVTWKVSVPTIHSNQLQVQSVTFDRFWRLRVFGGPFRVANDVWGTWIDDTLVGTGSEGRNELITILFDRTLLSEGAQIGVSRGTDKFGLTYLTEPLHISLP